MVLTNRRGPKEEQRTDAGDESETRKADSQAGRNASSSHYSDSYSVDEGWTWLEILKWTSVVILTICAILVLYQQYTLPSPEQMRAMAEDRAAKMSSPDSCPSTPPAKKPGDKPGEQPVKKTADKPVKKTADKPVKKTADKPAKEPGKGKKTTKSSSTATEAKKDELRVEELDLTKVPLLQWPIAPSDPDRPLLVSLLSGDKLLRLGWYKEALDKFKDMQKSFPQSPRALFGIAEALCHLAKQQENNTLLDECIESYRQVGIVSFLTPIEFRIASLTRLIEPATFRGKSDVVLAAMKKLHELKPKSEDFACLLAVQYVKMGRLKEAKTELEEVLKLWPKDLIAKAHLGYVLMTAGEMKEALPLLLEGIRQSDEIKNDPKFYFFAGDALTRLNRKDEADALYSEAVGHGLFPSQWQRPVVYERGLRASPFWSTAELRVYDTELRRVTAQLADVKTEALHILEANASLFQTENPTILASGNWRTFSLFDKGRKNVDNCNFAPKTCALLDSFTDAAQCTHGQVKFALLSPNTVMWPHASKANTKLRFIYSLQDSTQTAVKVAEETRPMVSSSSPVIFDNSFEHQLMNQGDRLWLGLIVDVWHPDLSEERKHQLQPF